MNYLLFGDLHSAQNNLAECKQILDEIIELCKTYSIDRVFDLGDTFDCVKPSSLEQDLLASFIKSLNRPITIIAAQSHESTTLEDSTLNHFGILNEMVTIVKEYKDENYLYCGHFIVKEAKKNFGATISKSELKYKYVFLGHQHSFELIKPNICQLGSCKYTNFDEVNDKQKVVAIITNYGDKEKEKVDFIGLKSPIPMIQIELRKEMPILPQKTPLKACSSQTSKDMEKEKSLISQAQNPPRNSISKGVSHE